MKQTFTFHPDQVAQLVEYQREVVLAQARLSVAAGILLKGCGVTAGKVNIVGLDINKGTVDVELPDPPQ